jgi:hypothetical protein
LYSILLKNILICAYVTLNQLTVISRSHLYYHNDTTWIVSIVKTCNPLSIQYPIPSRNRHYN